MFNFNELQTTRLETLVALRGLKRLTASKWADSDLPFHLMTNLEYVSLETIDDLSIASSGQLRCLSKLNVLKLNAFHNFSMYLLN
jgi:hypothetical protein